jgi:hypothetical protein
MMTFQMVDDGFRVGRLWICVNIRARYVMNGVFMMLSGWIFLTKQQVLPQQDFPPLIAQT